MFFVYGCVCVVYMKKRYTERKVYAEIDIVSRFESVQPTKQKLVKHTVFFLVK